jgi:putative hemolysin
VNVIAELGVIALLTLVNGVFTGAEIAMLSVRKTRLAELAGDGSRAARTALALRRKPENMLATLQVGVTVIGATTAVFGGARLEAPIARWLGLLGLGRAAPDVAFVVVIALVSYLSLVLGELVPKSLALQRPERFALLVARPLAALANVSRPFVWLLTASSNAVLRPFRDRTSFSEARLSPEELQHLVEESAEAGVLDATAGDIASRAIDLGALRVNALMVPRSRIAALDVAASDDAVLALLRRTPHARYPVFEHDREHIIGYVLARDVTLAMLGGALELRALVRPVPFFPETARAVDVLRALQAAKGQLGLLVDEQGALAGLVTLEDVAEDLLGEIVEEHEDVRPLAWTEEDGRVIVARGEAPVHEVERLLRVDLEDETGAATLAGLLTERLRRLPVVGDTLVAGGRVEIVVTEATPRRVVTVRLRVLPEADPGT